MHTGALQQTTEKKDAGHLPFLLAQRTRPLRRKIVFWNVLVLFFALILMSVTTYLLLTAILLNDLDQQLRLEGEGLQAIVRLSGQIQRPYNTAFLQRLLEVETSNEFSSDAPKLKLLDPQTGMLLARSPNLTQARIPLNITDFMSALRGQQVFSSYQTTNGHSARLLTLPLRDTAGHIVLVAQVSLSQAGLERVQNLLIMIPALAILVVTLLAYAIGLLLTTRELRPLHTLNSRMRSLSAEGLGGRISQQSAVLEIRQLTDAFNQMAAHLEASFALQRNFIGTVSHELRTPLTAIQGQLDVLLLDPTLQDEARQDVQQVRAELGRLSRLVNNLLMTARAEVGIIPRLSQPTQPVELDTLLIAIARQARFLNPNVALNIQELHQANVPGNADLLKQLILNIVDNALTYTPAGGKVDIALVCTIEIPSSIKSTSDEAAELWACLSICDTGPGIDPADLPHIFERLYRSERSSSMSSRTALHTGLGLAMAHLIAEAHGGSITVKSEPGKGSCFTLWLPGCHEVFATSTSS